MNCLPLFYLAFLVGAAPSLTPVESLDSRLKIELFAAEPDLVTPAGLTVDAAGRVLVVESHTHFRPPDYDGPPADRIRMLVDTNGDDRADRITTFFEGTQSTMNVAVHPDGSVYVATRMEIFRLRDTDDDGHADEHIPIARLETAGNYPHNGLSGFAFDFAGNVYFGLGENLGAEFKLIGTDGSLVSDLEGGQIYRCRADGSHVERLAMGFWNPFHLAFDSFGRLFAVDNDPDSLPPCRLLHIVSGGNYGYRYRNGRKGVHPFTAWNGELPGTLPMVAGTGEAPSGVVVYESDHLPDDYRGNLLVTSWGDHRIERYRLAPRGASFQSQTETIVRGDENFRPVGIALAPDGSLFVSDWVLQDYNVHGRGRVWHITTADPSAADRPTTPATAIHAADRPTRERAARALLTTDAGRTTLHTIARDDPSPRTRALALSALHTAGEQAPLLAAFRDDADANVRVATAHLLAGSSAAVSAPADDAPPEVHAAWMRHLAGHDATDRLWAATAASDAFLAQAARAGLARLHAAPADLNLADRPAAERLAALLMWREAGVSGATARLPELLSDPDADVRFAAVQWVGEERLTAYRQPLERALSVGPATARLFGGYLAALERLDGVTRSPSDEWAGEQYMVRALDAPATSDEARRWALRMLRPDHPLLTAARLRAFLASPDENLQLEAIRSVRESPLAEREALLWEVILSPAATTQLRAEALVGVTATEPASIARLLEVATTSEPTLRDEALRSLRGAELSTAQRHTLSQLATNATPLVARLLHPQPAAAGSAPPDVERWFNILAAGPGDPQAGERIFFHPAAAACSRCHQIGGRGARIGPELTATARALNLRRLVESIVDPSREIAPQFVAWLVVTTSGQALTGVLVDEKATGEQTYADAEGRRTVLTPGEIESRRPLATSLMPAGLLSQLTDQEFRDLVAFLRGETGAPSHSAHSALSPSPPAVASPPPANAD